MEACRAGFPARSMLARAATRVEVAVSGLPRQWLATGAVSRPALDRAVAAHCRLSIRGGGSALVRSSAVGRRRVDCSLQRRANRDRPRAPQVLLHPLHPLPALAASLPETA